MENFILSLSWVFGVLSLIILVLVPIVYQSHNSNPIKVAIEGKQQLDTSKYFKTVLVFLVCLAYLISYYFM